MSFVFVERVNIYERSKAVPCCGSLFFIIGARTVSIQIL